MTEIDFDLYSEQSVHFFSRHVPDLLRRLVGLIGGEAVVVDVGCGDGHLVWTLLEAGLINRNSRVYGVDLSPIRLKRFNLLTGFSGILANGSDVPTLGDASIDLTISTMVIEHVPDELAYTHELARMTRSGGWLYLSTVIRKRGAWYFRKAPDGRRVLDPTHLREYATVEEVIRLVEAAGFTVKAQHLSRLIFPLAHPLVRWVHAWWPIKNVQHFFLKRSTRWLEALALPIPRYRSIELIAQRNDPSSGAVAV